MDGHGTLGAHGDGGEFGVLGDFAHGFAEVLGLVERFEFVEVGKDVVDGLGADQVQKFGAIAIDAERIAEGEGGGALVPVGVMGGQHEGFLGFLGVPQVIYTAISRAKFEFIREPLLFSDHAMVLDVMNYKELFHTGWIGNLFWFVAVFYVFGVSAAVMIVEPTLLPNANAFGAFSLGIGAWLASILLLFWKPARQLAATLSKYTVQSYDVRPNVLRFGTFSYVILSFLIWLGAGDVTLRAEPADAIDTPVDRLVGSDGTGAPLVVVWQSESFIDLRRFGHSSIALPNLDALRMHSARWGQLSSIFEGGYTLRTEFAVLSGINPVSLGLDASYPYLRTAAYSQRAWPNRFRTAGWRTHFIHPYDRKFFNRHRAIPDLGFAQMTMLDGFDHVPSVSHPYVSDQHLSERVVDICRQVETSTAAFLFVASMGNHGPWEDGRRPGAIGAVEIYSQLLEAADIALGQLVNALNTLDRPVWLAFYGDHAPLLKEFADPFADPRTDYLIVPLGTAAKIHSATAVDENPWGLIETLAELATKPGNQPMRDQKAPARRVSPP